MSENSEDKKCSKYPAELFSPFKTLFIGYVVLIALDKIVISDRWEFLWVSFVIMVFEIGHNDFLRKILNKQAEK